MSASPVGLLVCDGPLLVGIVGVAGRQAKSARVRLKRQAVAVQPMDEVLVCVIISVTECGNLCEECEAEVVLLIVVHNPGMEASIEAVNNVALPRKLRIGMTPKLIDVLKSSTEQTDLLCNFGHDFQSIVEPDGLEKLRRFPMNVGITGEVIKTGQLINCKNAKNHTLFHPDIDCYPGVECKAILAFPIREQTGIIGVGQLINKIGDPYFDSMDEEMALAFSIYCGVCITHSVVSDTELARIIGCTGFHNHPHLTSLHFNMRALPHRELPCYVLKIELQSFVYFIASLVHDMDHRGTTNSFQIQGTMCVLNTEGCDILESLPRRDYDRAIMLLRDYVLATDLANYTKNLNDFRAVSLDFQKGNRSAVLSEFFKQGDVEKSRGDLPLIQMDREKCFIPLLEIEFLNTICIPLYDTIGHILPKMAPCVRVLENHVERWDAATQIFAEVPVTAGLTILLSPELDELIEKNLKEKERQKQEAEEESAQANS
ncbi:unnamed protein product [Leptidea sinapis]|uniref:Phosphodiesterase n=1 Tax=Leptidea sinapis TaxID=189913 RepID=A0A5E4PST6_9NEOP|nr:unnamed protein product [Leptidea sinapis]